MSTGVRMKKYSDLSPRQKDALIAVKVFGLSVEHWVTREVEGYDLRTGYVEMHEFYNPQIPRYSSRIDDAWAIMDHIKPGRATPSGSEEEFQIRSRFVQTLAYEEGEDWWWSTREGLCNILCRAALQAYLVIDKHGTFLEWDDTEEEFDTWLNIPAR